MQSRNPSLQRPTRHPTYITNARRPLLIGSCSNNTCPVGRNADVIYWSADALPSTFDGVLALLFYVEEVVGPDPSLAGGDSEIQGYRRVAEQENIGFRSIRYLFVGRRKSGVSPQDLQPCCHQDRRFSGNLIQIGG